MTFIADQRLAAERAKELAFSHLLRFVREARKQGWSAEAFVPQVAWGLRQALAQAAVYEELNRSMGRDLSEEIELTEEIKEE